jgi:protein ImuA
VLAWLPQVRAEQLRRLQMAAQTHHKLLFVMRPAQAQSESSPAVLRLLASTAPDGDALLLHILKRRGPPLDQPLSLSARPARLAVLLASHAGQADDEAQEEGARRRPAVCLFPGSGDALDRTAAAA